MNARTSVLCRAAAAVALLGTACSAPAPPAPASPAAASPTAPAAVTPAALAGNWLFEMKAGGRSVEGSLHFAVVAGVLTGTFTRSDGHEQELRDIEIKGNEVAWDAEGAGGKQHARATVEGSSMKGTIQRSGGSRGGRRGGGATPQGEGGDRGSDAPDDSPPPGGTGRGGGWGGRGRGRRGPGGAAAEITFVAYKTVAPVETNVPAPTPTPGS